jgi:hypothetical protein
VPIISIDISIVAMHVDQHTKWVLHHISYIPIPIKMIHHHYYCYYSDVDGCFFSSGRVVVGFDIDTFPVPWVPHDHPTRRRMNLRIESMRLVWGDEHVR